MVSTGGGFLRQFDAFAKPLKDFRIKTVSGALVSICSLFVITILFISELLSFLSLDARQEIIVNVDKGEKMSIYLDITFPFIPCEILKLDTMDVTGEQQFNVEHEIYKTSVDSEGNLMGTVATTTVNNSNYCGSCYGAESATRNCCNTCEEVQQAYAEKHWNFRDTSAFEQCRNSVWNNVIKKLGSEGCRFNGQLRVNKVAGSFHVAPGHSYTENHVHVHNIQSLGMVQFNMSHNIKKLSFGDDYPGQINPLDGKNVSIEQTSQMVSYYLKLVPTMYSPYSSVNRNEKTIKTNQYSVTWHIRGTPLSNTGSGLPGIFFNYEIAPILVKISEDKKSFLHFLTNTCAIIGGVFTVAGLLDAFIYQSSCLLQKRASGHSR